MAALDKLPKYLDQAQIRAILERAYARSDRDGLMFEIAYLYGLRVSELVRLDRDSFRRESKRLRIDRSKGSHSGEFPLFEHLIPKIEAYLASRSDKIPALFAGRQGRLSTRRVQSIFDAVAKASSVPLNDGQGIHSLRHSIAVHLLEDGWDVIEVQKHLGHRRISSTQVYAQISDRRRNERIKALAHSSKIVTVQKSPIDDLHAALSQACDRRLPRVAPGDLAGGHQRAHLAGGAPILADVRLERDQFGLDLRELLIA